MMGNRNQAREVERLAELARFAARVVEKVQEQGGCGCPGPVVTDDGGAVAVFWSEHRCPVAVRAGPLLGHVLGVLAPGAAYAVSTVGGVTDD